MLAVVNRYPFDSPQQWVSYLPEALQTVVVQEMELRDYKRGDVIYALHSQTHEIYAVVDGSIKITTTTEEGKDLAIIGLPRGCTFGELSFVDGKPRQNIAIATSDCTLAVLHKKNYLALSEKHPELNQAMLQFVAFRLRTLSDIHQDSNSLDLARQLAKYLIYLFGNQSAKETNKEINSSQEELASILGVSRQHVNKALKRWQSEGLLEISYRKITLLDLDGLQQIAAGQ